MNTFEDRADYTVVRKPSGKRAGFILHNAAGQWYFSPDGPELPGPKMSSREEVKGSIENENV